MGLQNIMVLIVDSSPVYSKMFRSAVEEIDENVAITCVVDGKDAADVITGKKPEIVILDADVREPGLLELLKLIIQESPKSFVLVTSRPSSTSAKVFMDALSAGASDSMTKPIHDSYSDNFETIKSKMSDMIGILRNAGTSDTGIQSNLSGIVKDYITGKAGNIDKAAAKKVKAFRPQIILFAVSTGGPRALEKIIPELDPGIPVPILIVQHMPPHFIETLAGRLNVKSRLKVKVAEDGERIYGGTVYLAPGGVHLRLNADNEVYLDDSPPVNGVRPAADALFESVANDFAGMRVLTVILTGMGQDSLKGMIKLKDKKKCYCIAQSEKTCVVYGMPRVVCEHGLVDMILDLDDIAQEIGKFNYI